MPAPGEINILFKRQRNVRPSFMKGGGERERKRGRNRERQRSRLYAEDGLGRYCAVETATTTAGLTTLIPVFLSHL